MANCNDCGGKARRPSRSNVGKQVTQQQPARKSSGGGGNDHGRSKITGLAWNSK